MLMKKIFLYFSFALTAGTLFSQDLPSLQDEDLLQPGEIGKKTGWVKVRFDASFHPIALPGQEKYAYYRFSSKWGYKSLLETPDKFRIVYRPELLPASTLLNGVVDLYDAQGHLAARAVFRNGFLVKEWDFYSLGGARKFPGRLNYVAEFHPEKNKMDWRLNAYNKKGVYTQFAHQVITQNGMEVLYDEKEIDLTLYIAGSWYRSGKGYFNYYMNTDTVSHSGKYAMTIKAIDQSLEGPGKILQTVNADKYKGKRIKMTGYVKTAAVSVGWAGLRLEVNEPNAVHARIYDHMRDRKITGTTDWTKYELVLDVPEYATTITFGLQLEGQGQVWMDDLKLEVVDRTVPVTGVSPVNPETFTLEPAGLDFEK
jgi:hypothetical protein